MAGGDLKPRRKLAGNPLRGSVLRVVCVYGTLAVRRIRGWQQLELGWPELTGMKLTAAPAFG